MLRYDTQYAHLKENEVYLLFCSGVWEKMSAEQRRDALQEIENRVAAAEGREPYYVDRIPADMEEESPNTMGYIEFAMDERPVIHLNSHYFENDDDLDFMDSEFSAVNALHTLLHEGRHCFQREAVLNGNERIDPETLRMWAANAIAYFDDDETHGQFGVYQFQPMERDANCFAAETIKDLYRHIVNLSGERDREFEADLERMLQERIYSGMNVYENVDEKLLDEYRKELRECLQEALDDPNHYWHELAVIYGLDPDGCDDYIFGDVYRITENKDNIADYLDGLDTVQDELDDFSDLAEDLARFDDWFKNDFTILKELHPLPEAPDRRLDTLDRGFRRFF